MLSREARGHSRPGAGNPFDSLATRNTGVQRCSGGRWRRRLAVSSHLTELSPDLRKLALVQPCRLLENEWLSHLELRSEGMPIDLVPSALTLTRDDLPQFTLLGCRPCYWWRIDKVSSVER